MVAASKNILLQLQDALGLLSDEEYQLSLSIFSDASVSQHVRHILEFYICLIDCKTNVLNFDNRKRDRRIEVSLEFTHHCIVELLFKLDCLEEDREIVLEASLNNFEHKVKTTIKRELLYVVEHAVHHMAIVKMGIMLNFPHLKLADNFGVAESTIAYRNQCAQ